jgi:undecaprenyl-diphosphatase
VALWFAAQLGLVQGLTEFLPISSTAHLRMLPALLGQPDPGPAFTAILQLGTLLAVFVYFGCDLFVTIPRAAVRSPMSAEGRLPWLIAVGTVPLEAQIEGSLRSLYVVAACLLAVGLLMTWTDARSCGRATSLDLIWIDAGWIGVPQACAVVPGVSRSDATICIALMVGMSRSEAARYSFLLGIPAIAGAAIFEARDAHPRAMTSSRRSCSARCRRTQRLRSDRVAHAFPGDQEHGAIRGLPRCLAVVLVGLLPAGVLEPYAG